MFREIRLKDRAANDERTIEIIKSGSYGVLSTMGEDGYPYGVPLNETQSVKSVDLTLLFSGNGDFRQLIYHKLSPNFYRSSSLDWDWVGNKSWVELAEVARRVGVSTAALSIIFKRVKQ
jgi:hypothetical protein